MSIKRKVCCLSLVSAMLSIPALASPGDWIKTSGDFATLSRDAKEVTFYVNYPQLRDGNCGAGIALNWRNSHERYYKELLEYISVTSLYPSSSGAYEMQPNSISRDGIMYSFDYQNQYYATYVTIKTKDNITFGEVFDNMSVFSEVHALTSAVTCKQLDDANTKL
ncbi:hypothetical protein PSECIP111951_02426 [Pseudoalteromonas holothuriae]|uniref:Uncharacterized protein n=1 Tax=Pseudoalteromonas holothuriae TaxID=2963714 RepID=A0ABN8UR60_9GAMM|nr:hypothetical protein [Pseudoalteromonas sp. CIP111951]CAH9061145.1 hypothetical protein PSECIP111951_02426 [Pseudoalteromonas sp. CIP111951]